MAKDPVDVCIVGSGAGGAPLALQLGRAGFKVVVLEKGPFFKKEDFVHDEVLNGRRNFFMPYPWEEPHLIRFSETAPFRQTNDAWTANCVGGGTVHMSGDYRLKPMDFGCARCSVTCPEPMSSTGPSPIKTSLPSTTRPKKS